MAAIPRCSECSKPLVFPEGHERAGEPRPRGTKTCGNTCRQRRARRRAKKPQRGGGSPHPTEALDMAAAVRGEVKDAAHEALKEELAPIVRETLTADVLAAIQTLVGVTPAAIQVLIAQMASEDEAVAQRAATLILKYTMGNPSVAPPPAEQQPQGMTVVFNVPRPGDTEPAPVAAAEPEELRQCLDCGKTKPAAEFVGSSPKCVECFDGLQAKLQARFK